MRKPIPKSVRKQVYAKYNGHCAYCGCTARGQFEDLWNTTIKKSDLDRYGWDASPWVWVIEFERCEKPEGV